jgi:hypothetical protein
MRHGPLTRKENNEGPGIAFDFMADMSPGHRIMTAQHQGTITPISRKLTRPSRKGPYAIKDFSKILELWLPLTFTVNSLNRGMGHNDFSLS